MRDDLQGLRAQQHLNPHFGCVAVSFLVHVCIHCKVFAYESKPTLIYKCHILVSIRRHKDVDVMRCPAVD